MSCGVATYVFEMDDDAYASLLNLPISPALDKQFIKRQNAALLTPALYVTERSGEQLTQ